MFPSDQPRDSDSSTNSTCLQPHLLLKSSLRLLPTLTLSRASAISLLPDTAITSLSHCNTPPFIFKVSHYGGV
ncbi:hypothetical protein E2C01_071303 [Portunus trituberculatus]|uniref:Uncharacterized protein n=1 Tax=Portunus trituberculatus TaxID=210409 RepID=A0A5B7I7M7_PORTR|nr:hypothetical protein [Portunus trituberculatus]